VQYLEELKVRIYSKVRKQINLKIVSLVSHAVDKRETFRPKVAMQLKRYC